VSAPRSSLAPFLMQVMWPAFVGAAISSGVVFSLIDPLSVDAVHEHLDGSREAGYSVAFVGLWWLHALACALTWQLGEPDRRR